MKTSAIHGDSTERPRSVARSRAPGWVRRLCARFTSRAAADDLLASLNDVASAVSSTLSVDDVLSTIVERAKKVTDTQKAVLLLTSEQSETLDFDTLTVRGSRLEHPEAWWGARLQAIASDVLSSGRTYLYHDKRQEAWMLCTPIKVRERSIGLLCAMNEESLPFSDYQIEYLAILSSFAAAAVESARLAEENSYVLLASERDRIAREMHDGIAQSLFSISLGLEVCKKQLFRDPNAVGWRLEELQEELNASMVELRRVIYDLRPIKLQKLGLPAAIEHWVSESVDGRHIRGSFTVTGEPQFLTGASEACLYSVVKEAVSNVIKHANAQSFEVSLDYRKTTVVLCVSDDGEGFEFAEAKARPIQAGSVGLHSIAHRVRAEGGTLDIASTPDEGTKLRVELPLGEETSWRT